MNEIQLYRGSYAREKNRRIGLNWFVICVECAGLMAIIYGYAAQYIYQF